jgi:hypothetical protein
MDIEETEAKETEISVEFVESKEKSMDVDSRSPEDNDIKVNYDHNADDMSDRPTKKMKLSSDSNTSESVRTEKVKSEKPNEVDIFKFV